MGYWLNGPIGAKTNGPGFPQKDQMRSLETLYGRTKLVSTSKINPKLSYGTVTKGWIGTFLKGSYDNFKIYRRNPLSGFYRFSYKNKKVGMIVKLFFSVSLISLLLTEWLSTKMVIVISQFFASEDLWVLTLFIFEPWNISSEIFRNSNFMTHHYSLTRIWWHLN